jgi:ABC-type transport system substrate-binding protein
VNKRHFLPVLGFGAAAVGLTAALYLFGAVFHSGAPAEPPAAAEVAAVMTAREQAQSLEGQPRIRITQAVDYREGPRAAWWPSHEAPMLAELVHEGKLPPVAERVGPEPVVMAGVDGVGRYGGSWQRLANSFTDINTIQWRLSYPNLVRWSPLGEPLVPHLARAWQASPDDRVFTFWLRRGVRWSDGRPFTADDLVYWYEWEVKYFKVPPPRMLRSGAGMGWVEKVDDYCVRFCFAQPNPLFPERVASQGNNFEDFSDYLTPAHYLRPYHPALGDPRLIERTMRALNLSTPVAVYRRMKQYLNPEHPRLWPWVYHHYSSTPPYVFVRNPYYFAVDAQGNQLPYLDRLVMDLRPTSLLGPAASTGLVSMQDRHIRYEDHVLLAGEAKRNGYQVYQWFPATRSLFTIFPGHQPRDRPGAAGDALEAPAAQRPEVSPGALPRHRPPRDHRGGIQRRRGAGADRPGPGLGIPQREPLPQLHRLRPGAAPAACSMSLAWRNATGRATAHFPTARRMAMDPQPDRLHWQRAGAVRGG